MYMMSTCSRAALCLFVQISRDHQPLQMTSQNPSQNHQNQMKSCHFAVSLAVSPPLLESFANILCVHVAIFAPRAQGPNHINNVEYKI